MLVSSAHLKLASPVFKAMLQSNRFMEGQTLKTTGKVEIALPDDDAESVELLMNIVHNRSKRIPRQINVESLSQVRNEGKLGICFGRVDSPFTQVSTRTFPIFPCLRIMAQYLLGLRLSRRLLPPHRNCYSTQYRQVQRIVRR